MKNKTIVPMAIEPPEDLVDLYIRVSTMEQAMEGYSVAEQENRLKRYCEAMGFRIYKIHTDAGFSGASLDRPAIQEVIRDVRGHLVKKVIVWKLDRLSRSQKDTLIMLEDVFLANDCDFVSMMESFDTSTAFGRAIVGILAAFAQLERENIKERTMMGRAARIAKGHYNGSRPPVGYKFLPGCNDLVVDPFEAAIVREIFSLFLSGNSINGIATRMTEKYGRVRKWHGAAIRRVLENPIYIGKVHQNGELFDGLHEAIISETDLHMANAILMHNKEIKKQSCRSENLLTGLLYCGDCGARMQPRRIARGYDLRRYVCYSVSRTNKSMIRSDRCTNRLHPYTQEELDEIIINEIRKLAVDEEYVKSIIQEDSGPQIDEAELFQDRLKEVQAQMDKLLNLYQIGVLDLSDIEDRIQDLKREKETLQKSLDGASSSIPLNIQKVQSYAAAFDTAYRSGNTEYINRMIRLLIDKIVVLNADIEIHWTFC